MQKKVLIVNDGFPPHSWGGANTICYLHAKELKARGYDVRVFTTTQVREKEGESEYEGIRVQIVYTSYHPRWWAYKSLTNREVTGKFEKVVKDFVPDVVHVHNIHHYVSYRTITIAKKSGAKVFLTAHDVMSFAYQKLHHFIDYTSKTIPTTFNYHVPWWVNFKDARLRFNPFRNLIIRSYLKKADQIFAVSEALKLALAGNGISGNVSVVHNGMQVEQFQQPFNEPALRAQLGLENKKAILFVGRFTPDKGRDVTLKAFAEVSKNIPEVRLLVVGFDPKRSPEPEMEKLIDGLGIREKILFVPAVLYTEMYKYYRISDVVVVPSVIFDSFPNANLEAMAAGRPVIATCFGGSREAVEDGVNGFIINPLDIETFGARLVSLLQHPTETRRMGARGQEHMSLFTLTKMVDAYEAQ